MAKTRGDGIGAMIREVEDLAKRLRTDVRKRVAAVGVPKDLPVVAAKLRKRAAAAAEQVEKYVHQLRVELERGAKKPAKPKRKRAKPAAKAASLPM